MSTVYYTFFNTQENPSQEGHSFIGFVHQMILAVLFQRLS